MAIIGSGLKVFLPSGLFVPAFIPIPPEMKPRIRGRSLGGFVVIPIMFLRGRRVSEKTHIPGKIKRGNYSAVLQPNGKE